MLITFACNVRILGYEKKPFIRVVIALFIVCLRIFSVHPCAVFSRKGYSKFKNVFFFSTVQFLFFFSQPIEMMPHEETISKNYFQICRKWWMKWMFLLIIWLDVCDFNETSNFSRIKTKTKSSQSNKKSAIWWKCLVRMRRVPFISFDRNSTAKESGWKRNEE